MTAPRARAYIRLSRDDLKQPGTLAEKFANRADIARRIAERYGLSLDGADITCEQESGSKLASRPGMLALLSLARRGELPHLITPFVDRLLRGDKADEQAIEDALCIGNTVLYTAEQEPIRFGPDYDPLLFEVRSLGARMELRKFNQRRREADLSRTEQGRRSRGSAPYGYRHLRPVLDEYGRLITPARHEIIEEEFAILTEIFERARAGESSIKIAQDLNARSIPGPGTGRRIDASPTWRPGSIIQILKNPFYAGYVSSRGRVSRGRRIQYGIEGYILAREPGDWPAVLTLDEWRALMEELRARALPGAGRGADTVGLLTGILFNSCGLAMTRSYAGYSCRCGSAFRPGSTIHPGQTIWAGKAEAWARDILIAVIDAIPEDAITTAAAAAAGAGGKGTKDRSALSARLREAEQQAAERRRQAQEMMLRRAYFADLYGAAVYEDTARRVGAELEALSAEAARLREALAQPDPQETLPLIAEARRLGGIAALWDEAPHALKSALLRGVVRRIELHAPPEGRKYLTSATIHLWDWAAAYAPDLPPLRSRYR